jgi:hypothetical protein
MNKYTDEHLNYLKSIVKGRSYSDIAKAMKIKFPELDLNKERIKSLMSRFKLTNGRNTKFYKGQVSHNKGKKGWYAPGCEKTWFKKGNIPKNHLPVGTELMKSDGYIRVKIAEPNVWKQKHAIIWEAAHGPYNNKTHCVIFKDSDRTNFDLDNLQLITRKQLVILNKNRLISNDKDLTETGLLVGELIETIARRKKDEK